MPSPFWRNQISCQGSYEHVLRRYSSYHTSPACFLSLLSQPLHWCVRFRSFTYQMRVIWDPLIIALATHGSYGLHSNPSCFDSVHSFMWKAWCSPACYIQPWLIPCIRWCSTSHQMRYISPRYVIQSWPLALPFFPTEICELNLDY